LIDIMRRPVKPPLGVKRLFDLVRPQDEKYKPAFYYALRDTLVATNLDQAVKIGYDKRRRWRVVTLAGELIDTSGTMSGGGNKVARGGMKASCSQQYSAAAVKDMEKDLHFLGKSISKAKEECETLRNEIEKLENEYNEAVTKVQKLEMEKQTLEVQLSSKDTQIKSLKGQLSNSPVDEARIKELGKVIEGVSRKLKKSQDATKSLQGQVDELQQKIMEAGGSRLRDQTAKVNEIVKKLDKATKRLTQVSVTCAANKKKIAQSQKAIEKAEKELETSIDSLQNLIEESKQLEDDACEVIQAYNRAKEELKDRDAALNKMEKKHKKFQTELGNIRTVEVDILNQMEDYDKIIKDNTDKANHWAKMLKDTVKKIESSLLFELAAEKEQNSNNSEDQKEGQFDDENKNDDVQPQHYVPLTEEELEHLDQKKLKVDVTVIEESLSQMKPDMRAISEYRQKHAEYLQRVGHLDQITAQRNGVRNEYDSLRKKRLDEFMAGFSTITMKLKEMYQMLTLGGDAELELVDSLDPFSEGIVFSVRPPKKSWKNIHNLSGGEKTLSSLALIFALHHFKPTPLYVMDEIDAALDFKNVSIVANYIKERTKNAQFVIISLRNNMFELADRLVGIYKTDDVTKSITIDPRNFSVPAGLQSKTNPAMLKQKKVASQMKLDGVVSSASK